MYVHISPVLLALLFAYGYHDCHISLANGVGEAACIIGRNVA